MHAYSGPGKQDHRSDRPRQRILREGNLHQLQHRRCRIQDLHSGQEVDSEGLDQRDRGLHCSKLRLSSAPAPAPAGH